MKAAISVRRGPDGAAEFEADGIAVGRIVPWRHERIEARDEWDPAEEANGLRWKRVFTLAEGGGAERVRLVMAFETAFRPDYYMIPGVSYNGNHWGRGQEPKGLGNDGGTWTYAWHRTAVPGGTYSEGEGRFVALWGQPPEDMSGFSCSLEQAPGGVLRHNLIWPEEETPLVYSKRDGYSEAVRGELILRPGDSFTAVVYVMPGRVSQPRRAWRHMLDAAWRTGGRPYEPHHSEERLWQLGIAFAKRSLWSEDGDFCGFAIGLRYDHESRQWVRHRHYEIGWCGQNASLANSLLADYWRGGGEDSLRKGLATLDGWLARGRLANGLIRCHYDYLLFDPGKPEVQDACNLGAAALNLFEAARLAEACGHPRTPYAEAGLGLCDFVLRVQADDGKIGKSWTNDGESADAEGTIGCFLVPPLVEAYELTGKPAYLEAARRGYAYYAEGLAEDGYTTAGALDTYCIDKESAIPLLRAGLALYGATGEATYLQCAELAAAYLGSWQWHHTVRYGEDTVLGRLSYNTFGGTAVSTQHHHLDAYGLAFIPDWIRLSELTGNPIWRDRAAALWANASIGVSDGSLDILGITRPEGAQDEGFCHTRWGFPFRTTEWLVAWPTALRLEAIRRAGPGGLTRRLATP